MSACIHCAGRGEVYDDTCGAWEPCPVKCEAWFRVVADDKILESLETAYVPEPVDAMFFHEAMFEADHQPEYKER